MKFRRSYLTAEAARKLGIEKRALWKAGESGRVRMYREGKATPRKVGLAPIQRDGMEYEFTMVLDLGMDHNAQVSKTHVKAFDGKLFTPTPETGKSLLAWLNDGAPAPATELQVHAPEAAKEPPRTNADGKRLITERQRARLFALLKEHSKPPEELKKFLFDTVGSDSTKDIPMDDYDQVCAWIEAPQ